jgi:ribosomal protein S18 acetylase RimI-like enzyme
MRVPRRSASIGIAVDEAWRGRGIGTALMDTAAAWAVGRGLDALELDVADPNADARRLYERLGYGLVAHTLVKPL